MRRREKWRDCISFEKRDGALLRMGFKGKALSNGRLEIKIYWDLMKQEIISFLVYFLQNTRVILLSTS